MGRKRKSKFPITKTVFIKTLVHNLIKVNESLSLIAAYSTGQITKETYEYIIANEAERFVTKPPVFVDSKTTIRMVNSLIEELELEDKLSNKMLSDLLEIQI